MKDEGGGFTRFKVEDIHDLYVDHDADLEIFETAREGVRAAGDLERAKMFRIRSNSPRGPSLRYEDLESSDSPRRSLITPIKLEGS